MNKGPKVCVLLIIISMTMAVQNLFIIKPTCAEIGVTNPTIPTFSITLQTYPQYIPPTYGVDSSTGKAVVIKEGYTEVQKWIRVEIGGQPFIRYNNSEGQLISLYYNVSWKGNHDTTWQSLQEYHYEDAGTFVDSPSIGRLISFGFEGIESPASSWLKVLDANATQIDFQVEALIGYYNADNAFIGQTSGWSSTQTLNITDGSTTTYPGTTSQPSPNSQIGELNWEQAVIILLGITVIVLSFTIVILRRKLKQIQTPSYSSVA